MEAMNTSVDQIMSKKLVTLTPDHNMEDARKIFEKHHFHHIPIVEGEYLVGIVSEFDLMNTNRPFSEYKNIPISVVMTRKMATLDPSDKIGAASIVFLQNRFNSLPVVDEDKRLLGLVTTFDLLKFQYQQAYPGDNFPFS